MYDKIKNSINCKKWYAKHKQQKAEYNLKNREKRKTWVNKHNFDLHLKILEKLGNKCSNPYDIDHGDFLDDKRCLQIDHIHGNGLEKKKGISTHYYLHLLGLSEDELKTDYQLLCANCNWIKRVENNEVRTICY